MQTLLSLSGYIAFILTVACVFIMTVLLWLIAAEKGQAYMENYKDTFTSTASSNMGDMFLHIDPNRLFFFNIVAIIVLPILVWLITRDIPAMLAMLVMVMLLPSMFYKSMRKKRLQRFEH